MSETLITIVARFAVKTLLKPALKPSVSVATQRLWAEITTRTLLVPSNVNFERSHLGNVPVEKVQPASVKQDAANAVLFLHGGAFLIGSPRSSRSITGRIAKFTGITTYVADYRLAPEHPFPAALDDALVCYRVLLQQGITPDRIALAGDSAGAGLALSLCLRLRDQGLKQPACLALISPWVDLTNSKLAAVADDVLLSEEWLHQGALAYLSGKTATDPLSSPIHADLSGLPPTLIHAASEEILLNDSRRIAQRLAEARVTVSLRQFPHLWHDFQLFAGLISEATQSLKELAEFVCERCTTG